MAPLSSQVGNRAEALPVIDVAQAGGWSSTQTLLMCYQQPDPETLLAVVSESRKVRERGVG